jgi:DNA sulfur modification protein DndB
VPSTNHASRATPAASAGIRSSSYDYVFPAIRGVQAGRPYFVTMFPMRLIPRVFVFDEVELVPELRAQRTLNKARVPEMARYILDNPTSYVFSALTASVDREVGFETVGTEGPGGMIGTLTVPMSARFVINDGQHRRAAIQQALIDSPDLGNESIPIVLFLDVGLERCQQMFADLNRYAIRPAKSLGVLYDHRDELATITKLVIFRSDLLRDLTDNETNSLSPRSRKLFTLSSFHTATKALLEGIAVASLEQRVDLAADYWNTVAGYFPEWHQVRDQVVTSGDVRRDFIHSHAIVLHALGKVGNSLMRSSHDAAAWDRKLRKLTMIDWRRSNTATWEGRAMVGGNVSKTRANVLLTTAAIRTAIDMPLPPDELQLEEALDRGEK